MRYFVKTPDGGFTFNSPPNVGALVNCFEYSVHVFIEGSYEPQTFRISPPPPSFDSRYLDDSGRVVVLLRRCRDPSCVEVPTIDALC